MRNKLKRTLDKFFLDPKMTDLWFKTKNPLLGGVSPDKMIQIGRLKKLTKFVVLTLGENKP